MESNLIEESGTMINLLIDREERGNYTSSIIAMRKI